MISIKNIPLNTTVAFFYIEDENKVTFSEQVTLIEYDVYSEYSGVTKFKLFYKLHKLFNIKGWRLKS